MGSKNTYLAPWLLLREYKNIIQISASENNLDPILFTALLLHESVADVQAGRFELGFYQIYIEGKTKARLAGHWPKHTESNHGEMLERLCRSSSYGLGQIIGQTARELGFDGDYLWGLCDPEINITYSAKYLARCHKRARDNGFTGEGLRIQTLLYYNGGADKTYPGKVFKEIEDAKRVLQ